MKICVFGLGAMGGLLASRLANHDAIELSVIARGAHLAAVRERGLTVLDQGGAREVRLDASDSPAEFGPQDVVLNCLKAHDSWEAAPSMAPLFGPETAVVTCQNGLPCGISMALRDPGLDGASRVSMPTTGSGTRSVLGASSDVASFPQGRSWSRA